MIHHNLGSRFLPLVGECVTIQQGKHPLQNWSTSESDVAGDRGLKEGLRSTTLKHRAGRTDYSSG